MFLSKAGLSTLIINNYKSNLRVCYINLAFDKRPMFLDYMNFLRLDHYLTNWFEYPNSKLFYLAKSVFNKPYTKELTS